MEPTPWYKTLDDDRREAVFAVVRRIGEEIEAEQGRYRKLAPRHGTIPFGSAHIDPWLKMHAAEEFLRGLRRGETPERAAELAKAESVEAVKEHNDKGHPAKNDRLLNASWGRWEKCQEEYIDDLRRRVLKAAKPSFVPTFDGILAAFLVTHDANEILRTSGDLTPERVAMEDGLFCRLVQWPPVTVPRHGPEILRLADDGCPNVA